MSSRREELYERIRNSSKDEVIVEEMRRLGFWPEAGRLPDDPGEEIKRQGELARELRSLQTEAVRLEDEERALAELRKRRLLESRARRKETLARRERERQERAEEHRRRKASQIDYLGDGFSADLSEVASDAALLKKQGLPVFHTSGELAAAMGIDVGELRFLAYGRSTSRVTHYRRFLLPKKSGGMRLISAPMPRLKHAQRWVLDEILERVALAGEAHGFVADRSIVSNAEPHVSREVVVNLDLKDFFPTLTFTRVRGMFRRLGYSGAVATSLAMLCTEPEMAAVELDGTQWFVARGPRFLPQGSPASPAITNLVCRRLDRRLSGLAKRFGCVYTRYADDLTLSGAIVPREVGRLLAAVGRIVASEGFAVHPDKTRVMRRGRRQEVTGVVVNDKLGVDRQTLRRFRALLHQVELDGPDGKHWGGSHDVLASMHGFASFVAMVDPQKGGVLLDRVRTLMKKHKHRPAPKRIAKPPRWKLAGVAFSPAVSEPPAKSEESEADAAAESKAPQPKTQPKKPWWKFW